jgi:hypothetical protein
VTAFVCPAGWCGEQLEFEHVGLGCCPVCEFHLSGKFMRLKQPLRGRGLMRALFCTTRRQDRAGDIGRKPRDVPGLGAGGK